VWFSQPPPLVDTSRPQPIAAFDFDNTVATCDNTKGDASDWTFRKSDRDGTDLGVREAVRWLHQQGYLIVVMSNNSVNSLKHWSQIKTKLARKFGRIENFAAATGVPLIGMAGVVGNSHKTATCRFYKPNTGMWDWLCSTAMAPRGVEVCRQRSFYVGDSAGRRRGENGAGRNGDFGDYDKAMARAAGLPFFLETDFFAPGRPPILPGTGGRRLFA